MSMDQLHTLRVGGSYLPGRTQIEAATNYNYRGGQHELLLRLDRPTSEEIRSVKSDTAEFALYVDPSRVLFFLYRFGEGLPWSDCPYSIWMVSEDERLPLESLGPNSRALLTTILVAADVNEVKALRGTSFSPEFTRELYKAIETQMQSEISIKDYEDAINETYSRYPKTEQMLEHAIVRCVGGTDEIQVDPKGEFLTCTREEVLAALASPEPSPIADEVGRLIQGYTANFMEHVQRLGWFSEYMLVPKARCPIEAVALELTTKQIKEALDG